ncbi:MAG: hypothetical protein A4S17_13225 [Proteobacteria bacterium HN_bin10]|nr:MAG: hypothetical protein A4S17_13225 [Proteobacteria bacterium HN_bin10]
MKMRTIALCVAALGLASLAQAQETTTPAETPAVTEPTLETPAIDETPAPESAPAIALPEGVSAPPEGKGQVVFFRPNRFVGAALTFTVRENDADLGRLPNGRYFVHVAEPGIHEYEIGRNDTMRMEIEPGETYYAIQSTQMGIVAGRAVLSPSDAAAFSEAYPRMRLWEPRN